MSTKKKISRKPKTSHKAKRQNKTMKTTRNKKQKHTNGRNEETLVREGMEKTGRDKHTGGAFWESGILSTWWGILIIRHIFTILFIVIIYSIWISFTGPPYSASPLKHCFIQFLRDDIYFLQDHLKCVWNLAHCQIITVEIHSFPFLWSSGLIFI